MPQHCSNDTAEEIKSFVCTVFPCLTLSWQTLIILRIYFIETKLNFVSLGDKNVQGRRKIVGERDFSLQSSYTDQIQSLSDSRDQKFVTSLVQNAITHDF